MNPTATLDTLIIFVRDPVKGKVKKRLAATIGDDRALEIYKRLLQHTREETESLFYNKWVYYADGIVHEDIWSHRYEKATQEGADLGERMSNAFSEHSSGNTVIIGTDCPGISEELISSAFMNLNQYDVVIGPAYDGGYYLIGAKAHYPALFLNIPWSTATVLEQTLSVCHNLGLKVYLLPALHDVDEEKDLAFMKSSIT